MINQSKPLNWIGLGNKNVNGIHNFILNNVNTICFHIVQQLSTLNLSKSRNNPDFKIKIILNESNTINNPNNYSEIFQTQFSTNAKFVRIVAFKLNLSHR